jgi:hypothetical protein
VSDADTEFAALRKLSPGAELWQEGGQPLVFLPRLKVLSGVSTIEVDGLLCPRARDSYLTRLFFSKQLPVTRNWTAYTIMARSWHAISWQGVPADVAWLEILAMHLEAVK